MAECVHEFAPPSRDPRRRCELCGIVGRGARDKEGHPVEEGFFEKFTRERAETYALLRSPIQQRDHLADQS